MRTISYIILGILGIATMCLVIFTVKLERKEQEWQWLHPPNDDDGCSLLSEEDDPDGENSR